MSVIRFVHSDHLRLGSAVRGLANCPDWLRRAAAESVRKSVQNVMEAAVAADCDFLLIAGRLADSRADLELAVRWLATQLEPIRNKGIRLILTGHNADEHPILHPLNAFLATQSQVLAVWRDSAGVLRIDCPESQSVRGENQNRTENTLYIIGSEFHQASHQSLKAMEVSSRLAYVTVPGTQATADSVASYSGPSRQVLVTAGSPQSLGPEEQGVFGCRLVEADLFNQTQTVRLCATDTIRFCREHIRCPEMMTADRITATIADRIRTTGSTAGRTSIVDWTLEGTFQTENHRGSDLDEISLLKSLRTELQAGHSGIWPRRITYDSQTRFVAGANSASVVREFLKVSEECQNSPTGSMEKTAASATLPGSHRITSHTVTGLEMLSRVA